MELSWLEDLAALAECKNFSRAADARHLTQPAFSRRVRALETWAGTPFVDRTTHPISLTPSGEVFLLAARDVIRRLQQGRQEAADAAARLPTLRFAATHALSLTFFPKWLRGLGPRAATPMHLIADNMTACARLMQEGRAEFLLCHHHPLENRLSPEHFQWLKVGEDVLMPVSQRLANGSPRFCLPGTADAPVPLLAFDDHSGMGQIIAALPRPNRPLHGHVVFTSHLAVALKNLALDGEGVAWAPLSLVSEDLGPTGSLAAAAGPDWQIPIDIVLARPKARQSNVVEAFWALIAKQSA